MSATPLTAPRTTTGPTALLRRLLVLDAGPTTATGIAYLIAPGPIGEFLGYEAAPVRLLGVFLAVMGAFVGWLSLRPQPPLGAVGAVADVNLLWAAGSLVALAAWLDPTPVGVAYGVLQAVVVGTLGVLQLTTVRRLDR